VANPREILEIAGLILVVAGTGPFLAAAGRGLFFPITVVVTREYG
jgi:hypothetical protein